MELKKDCVESEIGHCANQYKTNHFKKMIYRYLQMAQKILKNTIMWEWEFTSHNFKYI